MQINLNIPIYRAKKIDSDEYVVGFYQECADKRNVLLYPNDEPYPNIHKIINSLELVDEEIDPSTLSIHFPDMLDSQGNKIFASLSEDGKGGSTIEHTLDDGDKLRYITYFDKKLTSVCLMGNHIRWDNSSENNKKFEEYWSEIVGTDDYKNYKVIGIQQ